MILASIAVLSAVLSGEVAHSITSTYDDGRSFGRAARAAFFVPFFNFTEYLFLIGRNSESSPESITWKKSEREVEQAFGRITESDSTPPVKSHFPPVTNSGIVSPCDQSNALVSLGFHASPELQGLWASFMARSRRDRVEAILRYLEEQRANAVNPWDADDYQVSWQTIYRAFYLNDERAFEQAFQQYYGKPLSVCLKLWAKRRQALTQSTLPAIPYAPNSKQMQLPFSFTPYLVEKKAPESAREEEQEDNAVGQ